MKSMFWNERYAMDEYVYGIKPNEYFKNQIINLTPGKILLPADGEGRNAVFAASLGWDVKAFDYSEQGKLKAEKLASENNVKIDYSILDINEFKIEENAYDLIGLFFVHLPEKLRIKFHYQLSKCLKPGGKIILEAFNPDQLKNNSGGPKKLEMLYSKDQLSEDFKDLTIETLEYSTNVLQEGRFHDGKSDLIRLIAKQTN